jgi:hypothetical protein
MIKIRTGLLIIGWLVSVTAIGNLRTAYGQLTVRPTPVPTREATLARQDQLTIATLRGIIQSMEALEAQLDEQQELLERAKIEEQKAHIAEEITRITHQLNLRQREFEEIATGVDLDTFEGSPQEALDWREEVHEVFSPIIEQLKELTARPRELESLRNEIAYYKKRLPIIRTAIEQVEQRIQQASAQKLKRLLEDVKQEWEEKEKAYTRQLSIATYQLEDKESLEQSLVTITQEVFKNFFKTRGRNLILAVLACIAVLLLMRYAYRLLYKTFALDRTEKRPFFLRVADVSYHVLTFLSATFALLLVLYVTGDWVLLGIALIFLVGIAWTARQTLPVFWEQIKLLLNMSTVREGERVIYNGLPWHVKSLHLYTKLHNPALKGGLIRLPLRALVGLQSRPFHKDEPWFPCQEGDLVILADGCIGTVSMQTPERVILTKLGGAHQTYPTLDFLQQNPQNYSINTFGVFATFGIDYQHQAIITQEIPDTLRAALHADLRKQDYGSGLLDVVVQFKEAGSSSLDLFLFTTWAGSAASSYFAITRALQRITVDVCNQNGWVIPFNQVTIHHAPPRGHPQPLAVEEEPGDDTAR